MGGIIEAPVEAMHLAGEDRAGLVCIPTDGDDGIDGPIQKLIHVLGMMSRDVDADLLQSLDGLGMNIPGRLRSCAGDFNEITGSGSEDTFGDVTPTGVTGAEDEDKWLHVKSYKVGQWRLKRGTQQQPVPEQQESLSAWSTGGKQISLARQSVCLEFRVKTMVFSMMVPLSTGN